MTTIQERLDQGGVILMDGAMGTELERRGVPMHGVAWSGAAVVTHPEIVRQVHEDYIHAGAEIIITNTFAMGPHVLRAAGMGERVRKANRRAVALAREAIEGAGGGRDVFVAGSISTTRFSFGAGSHPSPEEARAGYREQAELLAEGGVDFLVLEMLRDIEQSSHAIEAALATGLPVWTGFSCQVDPDGTVFLLGFHEQRETLAEALVRLLPLGTSAVAVMHTELRDTLPALRVVKEQWSGPLVAYPHHGGFVMPHWRFQDLSPEAFTEHALQWIAQGVQVAGGCCGIGPEHIRALRARLPSRLPDHTEQR